MVRMLVESYFVCYDNSGLLFQWAWFALFALARGKWWDSPGWETTHVFDDG